MVLFPADSVIDWRKLIDYFMGISEGIAETIGHGLPLDQISDFIKFQFVITVQQFVANSIVYDDQLIYQALLQIIKRIERIRKYNLELYWKQYHRLPLKTSLSQLKSTIASVRFAGYNARLTGIPIDYMDRLDGIWNNTDYADYMQKWLRLHEL